MKRLAMISASVVLATGLGAGAAVAGSPTVVELFTSQGCSSCPPANANLITLSDRPDMLTLSFAVTYWDYLGWKDSFGQEAYTDRQRIYEPALGEQGPFTPQMVVNGAGTVVGNRIEQVDELIARLPRISGPAVSLAGGKVSIAAGAAPGAGTDVWLVRYDPKVVEVPVARGENTGRTLPHTHVVHDLQRLGTWTGAAASFAVPQASGGLKTAVLVQGKSGGQIVGVGTD
ncbi:DUF1223 domain-containing protein [Devosia sp.]|uniref:DUF1223 domain-containing protein n=1 Tax=Devosia sp. TaxID=1871048 RepID=UPI003264F339